MKRICHYEKRLDNNADHTSGAQCSNAAGDEESSQPSRLLLLPDEVCVRREELRQNEHSSAGLVISLLQILLHICSFLDAAVMHTLSLVCVQLNSLMNNTDSLWKHRLNHVLRPKTTEDLLLRLAAESDKLFWKSSCIEVEKQYISWNKPQNCMDIFRPTDSGIDSLLLTSVGDSMFVLCKSEGTLFYRKISNSEKREERVHNVETDLDCDEFSSEFPLKSLTAIDRTIYVCDRSNKIQSWQFTNSGLILDRMYNIENLSLTCISSCQEQNYHLFTAGTTHGKIYMFDTRTSNEQPVNSYQAHKATANVTSLTMCAKYIYSVGCSTYDEEVELCIFDPAANRNVKSISIPIDNDVFPTCVSTRRDWVCVGVANELHVLDPNNDYNISNSYTHDYEMWDVRLTDGCLIRSFSNGIVDISTPTNSPVNIRTLKSDKAYRYDYTYLDYLNDTIAISFPYHTKVAVWCLKDRNIYPQYMYK